MGSSSNPLPSKSRMLVLCFDGTGNEYDGENTNIVKFFAMLRKDCDDDQLCYYQTGDGTYMPPGIWAGLSMRIAKLADAAIAWYLDAHVMDGYKFIMKNYRPGDKISIFGFSRGAYTARALAGFLTKIGLLPRDNDEQVTFAYKMYQRTDKEGLILAAGFKETFCRPVNIEFLGVWDTVASTGIITTQDLPFTTNNSMIKTFRHALSLDERRAKFVPTFWTLSTPQPPKPKPGLGASPAAVASSAKSFGKASEAANHPEGASDADASWWRFGKGEVNGVHSAFSSQESNLDTTDVKQVWFAGCHNDVGGGAEKNPVNGTLADISLRWMVREVVASQCGIQFDIAVMALLNVHVSPLGSGYFSADINGSASPGPRPSEEDCTADKVASTKPLHDELRLDPLWWILELIPFPFTWQDAKAKWHKKWECHLGRGRYVNTSGPLLFHETVRMRMNDTTLRYTPRAIYEKGKESYVW
ncbi:uncharacterized protein FOMMEDRAFT_114985 [Fomitiporia mediterranea MF3/22]|uniref:uncharacterized protein n=1 Tax=Fomitiporia mediterranea (strain MF3/22) TaxID=694068 RepID=UPI0004408489|nr:uncharacterized protein FOMMEDRAFT_114985 [Fomitiporia mediterranea MF3/22]EJC98129.1 hypothetical protein FOMMEDRAFT_114985 [Fomitiporia mediterranea MF3/22]